MTSQTGRRCRCRGCSLLHPTRDDGTAVTATIWAVFLASLTVTAYGVVHSDVLANLWPRTLAEQIAMLAVGAALTAGICIVACFGAAPTLAAAAVLACCVIYGEVLLAAAGTEVEDPVTVAAIGIGATIL